MFKVFKPQTPFFLFAKESIGSFVNNLLDENPLISKEEMLERLQESKLSKSKTAEKSYSREIRKQFLARGGEEDTRLTKDIVIESFDGQSKISDEEFARDDFIDSIIDDEEEELPQLNWVKKLLKTGKTRDPRSGKTSENIEIYTFVNNEQDEYYNSDSWWYDKLLTAVMEQIPNFEYIDDGGYQSDSVNDFQVEAEYVYPTARLRINSQFIITML